MASEDQKTCDRCAWHSTVGETLWTFYDTALRERAAYRHQAWCDIWVTIGLAAAYVDDILSDQPEELAVRMGAK